MSGIMNMFMSGGGSPATFTVTNGSYTKDMPRGGTNYLYGWSSILYVSGGTLGANHVPMYGGTGASSSPAVPLFYNAQVLGFVSEDTSLSVTADQAYLYTLILSGDQSSKVINTLSIGGTNVAIASQTTTYNSYVYSPTQSAGVTSIVVTPTIISTTLFTTTVGATKAVIIT